jgi:hypothetical protein
MINKHQKSPALSIICLKDNISSKQFVVSSHD